MTEGFTKIAHMMAGRVSDVMCQENLGVARGDPDKARELTAKI